LSYYLYSSKTTAESSEVTRNIMATAGEHIKLLNPPTLFDSAPSFSHVATFSSPVRMVYCAGQVGADVNEKAAEGLEAQVRSAFRNLKECLAAADASLRGLVKVTFYIVGWNQDMTLEFGKPLMEFLTDELGVYRPPSTLISVVSLAKPEWLFEVDGIAAVKN
jgi:enamine deaminase RidA (YjgF/YER057c/UK114 family)